MCARMGPAPKPALERILSKTSLTPNGCWQFNGTTRPDGYGVVMTGSLSTKRRTLRTHRIVYEELVAKIPQGLELDHLCRNRICCNPSHLEVVTHQENIKRGETHLVSKRRALTCSHCAQGHTFDLLNTYLDPRGWRQCRKCRSGALTRYHHNLKGRAAFVC